MVSSSRSRSRSRALGVAPGIFQAGPQNAITDVDGVCVGHSTLLRGDDVRTGVTVILPHQGNLHRHRVPAGVSVGNGFGKFFGSAQVEELGELETPIGLTNTLSVPEVAAGLIDWTLGYPGNHSVVSVNAVVGETNDCLVNDIRKRAVRPIDLLEAIEGASSGAVAEGSVGAGTGTKAFGWKGGIGTSSRHLTPILGGFMVGVLVQTNYGGTPIIAGRPIFDMTDYNPAADRFTGQAGSIIAIVATDAPLLARDLRRLAKRSFIGIGRTGSCMAHASGEFALAFSTGPEVRRDRDAVAVSLQLPVLGDDQLTALFQAVVEATEEAIYNAMLAATAVSSGIGRLLPAPLTIFSA